MCGRNLSSACFPSLSGQCERLDRFSSSMELLRSMEAGNGVFTKKDTAGDDENLCELCLHKMVQVVKSMARNLLLKPSVGMIKTSLQAATADSQGKKQQSFDTTTPYSTTRDAQPNAAAFMEQPHYSPGGAY